MYTYSIQFYSYWLILTLFISFRRLCYLVNDSNRTSNIPYLNGSFNIMLHNRGIAAKKQGGETKKNNACVRQKYKSQTYQSKHFWKVRRFFKKSLNCPTILTLQKIWGATTLHKVPKHFRTHPIKWLRAPPERCLIMPYREVIEIEWEKSSVMNENELTKINSMLEGALNMITQ